LGGAPVGVSTVRERESAARDGSVRRPGGLVGVVFGALGVAVLAMVVLHLLGAGRLDPAATTVSDFVSLPGGAALLAVAVLGVATAAAAVLIGLLATGLPNITRPCLLYGLGCAGLVATIAFPTNALGTVASSSTVLHRYAAAAFFVSLPVAALLTRHVVPSSAVGRLTAVSVLTGIAFLVSHIPLLFPDWPGAREIATALPRGLVERVLLVVDIALLGTLARSIRPVLR
jgi:hypothetical protein